MIQPGFMQVLALQMPPNPGVQTHASPTREGELVHALTTVARLRSSVLYVQVVMSSSPWGGGGSNTDTWRCESAELSPLRSANLGIREFVIQQNSAPCSGASLWAACFPASTSRGAAGALAKLASPGEDPLGPYPRDGVSCFPHFLRISAGLKHLKKMRLGNILNCQTST